MLTLLNLIYHKNKIDKVAKILKSDLVTFILSKFKIKQLFQCLFKMLTLLNLIYHKNKIPKVAKILKSDLVTFI